MTDFMKSSMLMGLKSLLTPVGNQQRHATSREAAKRRGVQFSNEAAFFATEKHALDDPPDHEEVGRTISAWVDIPKEPTGTRTILAQRNGALKISVGQGGVKACLKFDIHEIELTDPATHYGEWVHYAVTIKTGKLPDLSMVATLELFKNGNPIDERQVIHSPDAPDSAVPPSGPHDEIDIGTMNAWRQLSISMDGDLAVVTAGRAKKVSVLALVDGHWQVEQVLTPKNSAFKFYIPRRDHNTAIVSAPGSRTSLRSHVFIYDRVDGVWSQTPKILIEDV